MSSERYDVVVAGAGPPGLLAAALVAGRGHRVLLLERGP
ncbi:NAD(P)/FAD-dependent oxidoreductase [Streptomyces tricolor]|nr:NAD(P)/FAD-dependent oxidoreductase [Streptomyces tricolor]